MENLVRTTLFALLISLTMITMTACSTMKLPIGNPEAPYPPETEPVVGEIFHLPTGTKVTLEQMLAVATDSRVIYVGETHDNPAAHRLELQVLQAMADRYPGQVSLGMEMFNTEQQVALDQWVSGELDEKSFLKKSQWYDNWRMDFAYYRDILFFARDRGIPVIGLNAPKDLVREVGSKPSDQLDLEQMEKLPDMDLADPYQRAMTEAVFSGHGPGQQVIDGFHRVQTLWDETMAENVVKELHNKGASQHMVVMAGANHVRYGFGIPRRAYRRMPLSYQLIGVREVEIPEDKLDRMMDVEMPLFPMVSFDYLVHVKYEDLPQDRVKLGVQFKDEDGRILVEFVVPDSTAELAGVKKGDIIIDLGGTSIKESFDLIFKVGQYSEGDETELTVERDGQSLTLPVTFKSLPADAANREHGK